MKSYCLKNTENINSKVSKTSTVTTLLSKVPILGYILF